MNTITKLLTLALLTTFATGCGSETPLEAPSEDCIDFPLLGPWIGQGDDLYEFTAACTGTSTRCESEFTYIPMYVIDEASGWDPEVYKFTVTKTNGQTNCMAKGETICAAQMKASGTEFNFTSCGWSAGPTLSTLYHRPYGSSYYD